MRQPSVVAAAAHLDERGSLMSLTTAIGQVGFGAVGTVAAYSSFGFLANAVLAAAAALATAALV